MKRWAPAPIVVKDLTHIIPFVAHVVPGKNGLLLGRSDMKSLGAAFDLKTEHLHFENPRVTLKPSTTPAGHFEINLVNRNSETAIVVHLQRYLVAP